jgi:hypothetical protein
MERVPLSWEQSPVVDGTILLKILTHSIAVNSTLPIFGKLFTYVRDVGSHGNKQSLANVESMIDHIGNTMVDWIAPPYFYKKGQLIVLYVGINTSVIHILETSLGHQFAGR